MNERPTIGRGRLPTMPLGDFPDARWSRVRKDIDDFLTSPFAQQAGALGWGALDLYGVDAGRPYARIDQAGLVTILNGRMIVGLNADAVILQTADGTRQTYHRKHNQRDGGRVLIWDLIPD